MKITKLAVDKLDIPLSDKPGKTAKKRKELEKNIINLYGEQGKKWLTSLSEVTARIAIAHGLSNLQPVNNLSYNYVLSGFRGPQPIILKLSLDTDDLKREALALKAFAGLVRLMY